MNKRDGDMIARGYTSNVMSKSSRSAMLPRASIESLAPNASRALGARTFRLQRPYSARSVRRARAQSDGGRGHARRRSLHVVSGDDRGRHPLPHRAQLDRPDFPHTVKGFHGEARSIK